MAGIVFPWEKPKEPSLATALSAWEAELSAVKSQLLNQQQEVLSLRQTLNAWLLAAQAAEAAATERLTRAKLEASVEIAAEKERADAAEKQLEDNERAAKMREAKAEQRQGIETEVDGLVADLGAAQAGGKAMDMGTIAGLLLKYPTIRGKAMKLAGLKI